MTSGHQVVVINIDARCNYWKETLTANDALLTLLRFLRKHPQAACTIELRLPGGVHAAPAAVGNNSSPLQDQGRSAEKTGGLMHAAEWTPR